MELCNFIFVATKVSCTWQVILNYKKQGRELPIKRKQKRTTKVHFVLVGVLISLVNAGLGTKEKHCLLSLNPCSLIETSPLNIKT